MALLATGLVLAGGGLPFGADAADSTRSSPPAPLLVPGQARDPLESRGDRALEHYRRGRAYEDADKPAAALQAYQNAVLADPTFPDAYFRLGMLYQGVGNHEEARQCFAAELQHHPDHEEAKREIGFSLAQLGQGAEAVGYLKPYVERHPEDGLGWYGLGYAYMQNGQADDAERALRKAISLNAGNGVWHRDLGAVLAARGQVAEARREYELALALNPDNPTPYINIGNLERREGDLEGALAAYRSAEAVDSSMSIAYHAQTQVLMEMEREHEVVEVYRRWLSRQPDEHATRLAAARYMNQVGYSDEAVELAVEGVRLHPNDGEARVVLGLTLYTVGDYEGALAQLMEAESTFKAPQERMRVRSIIARMKQEVPDSLRSRFPSDSALGLGG